MGGYIMQVQNMSVNDGSGIRATVFMAGCPLRCAWCANPEGQTSRNAMTHWAETQDVIDEVHRSDIFFRFSGGGVTFSGGEPGAQPDFLDEMSSALYDEGYDLAVETCGMFDFDRVRRSLSRMDTIFMDLKHPDSTEHDRFTGAGNELILENMRRTGELGIPMVIRIPAIVGVNGDDESMEAAFTVIKKLVPEASLELLPYHRYGESKYEQLGMTLPPAEFRTPSESEMGRWSAAAETAGLKVVSYK